MSKPDSVGINQKSGDSRLARVHLNARTLIDSQILSTIIPALLDVRGARHMVRIAQSQD